MRRVRKAFEALGVVLVALASWVTPRASGRVAFVSLFHEGRFRGDAARLFEAAADAPAGIEGWWVARGGAATCPSEGHGLPVHRHRLHWLLALNRAEWVVTDDVRPGLALGRYRFVQLWHGTGFKRIGIDNPNRSAVGRWLWRHSGRQTAFVTATSAADADKKARSLAVNRAVVTGAPRNDRLFSSGARTDSVRRRCGIPAGELVCLYAPTFRDGGRAFAPFDAEDWSRIDQCMATVGGRFLVCRHPADRVLDVPRDHDRVLDVTGKTEEIHDLLSITDLLVTDYSAIVTDFVLTGRPVIFHQPDLAEYMAHCRTFHYPFPEVLPGPFTGTTGELLERIACRDWFDTPDYRERYEAFVRRFHDYRDGHLTERVLAELRRVVRGE